ncbi:ACP S-malonyltransferase [Buchnera aphidicola]|nr:acyltransferase domain-containing protein [Buchnera aphidicola]
MRLYAMLFPGQEKQKKNVLLSLIKKYKIIKQTFDESSEYVGHNLYKLVDNSSQQEMDKSKYTKLITLTISVAMYRLWQQKNRNIPVILSGHSLGEYSALVCAESLKFCDAIKLIILRDKFMKESMKHKLGAMNVIIGLKQFKIEKILKKFNIIKEVSIACINTYNQIVISGEKCAVYKVSSACQKIGAKKIFRLSINPPSHCMLMIEASKKLSTILKHISFKIPIFPIVNNVDVKCETSAHAIRSALTRQLYNPVRWSEIITYLSNKYVSMFIELGLNNTLTNLNKSTIAIPSISPNNTVNFYQRF